jgi:DNA-binding CsgD family transcriptional regulator
VEAEAAERARAARDEDGIAEAGRRGAGFASRLRELDDESVPAPYRSLIGIGVAFGEAEATRIADQSDPVAWRRAADAAEARPIVYYGAYARFREAEAILAGRGSREAAAALLADARRVAADLGAKPLLETIAALVARARLSVGSAEPAPDAAVMTVPDGVAGYELTARELEVLRLVAIGRTNRQIGAELFISESTAGVHVSRILGKLGVTGRVEAATIATRLGLAE